MLPSVDSIFQSIDCTLWVDFVRLQLTVFPDRIFVGVFT